ncbi:MAG TPA: hypothetical protein VFV92_14530 [Candidatus Bathyarchaeia archaeon]|nr:hypothetical protein [Candidatus Bathyarchaeia archaeon]
MNYDFVLRYKIDPTHDVDAVIEVLGSVGCTDAIIGSGIPGILSFDFSREADSAAHAIVSAISCVEFAFGHTAELIHVSFDSGLAALCKEKP